MNGQRGEEADQLFSQSGEAKPRREAQIPVCENTPLCPPLDMPYTWMGRLFLEEKDLEFKRDGI